MDNVSNKLNQHILHKAIKLKGLQQAICAYLPTDCHSHFQVSGLRNNALVIITDSPVWQTRLRMYSQSMLEALEQHSNIKLHQVKIRLSPPKRQPETPPPTPRILSSNSASIIEQTARCISDENLQNALLRLSRKAKSPK